MEIVVIPTTPHTPKSAFPASPTCFYNLADRPLNACSRQVPHLDRRRNEDRMGHLLHVGCPTYQMSPYHPNLAVKPAEHLSLDNWVLAEQGRNVYDEAEPELCPHRSSSLRRGICGLFVDACKATEVAKNSMMLCGIAAFSFELKSYRSRTLRWLMPSPHFIMKTQPRQIQNRCCRSAGKEVCDT